MAAGEASSVRCEQMSSKDKRRGPSKEPFKKKASIYAITISSTFFFIFDS